MIAVWDARGASDGLKYCMRVISGPDIVSSCGFVHKSHIGRASLNSYKREFWSHCGPERNNSSPLPTLPNREAVIALAASKIPNSMDSEVECMIVDLETGDPLEALINGEQINGETGWIPLMHVSAPTTSQNSTIGYTLVQS